MKRFAALVVVPLWLSSGCASPEEEVVDRYLQSAQRGDSDTMSALSMVVFPDEVDSWNILEIGTERRAPYLVPELREKISVAEDERDAQFKVFGQFRQSNYDALRRIGERLRNDPDYRFPGQMGELQDRWEVFRLERREVVAKLHEAEIALEQELRRVNKSLQRESSPEYLTGETRHKAARVRVTTPTGDQHYTIELIQYELKNQFDALVPARWIVSGVAKAE